MQVRTGGTASAAHLCNFLSPYHYLADFNQALGSVRVPTDELITVVNINHITAVEGNMLCCHKYQVPISKYQKEEVMEKIVNRNLLKK